MEESDIILSLLKKGEKRGLEMLFRRFYSPLVLYACKFIHERSEAEDIVQEVFIKFWKRDKFSDIESYLRSYLYQSVRNTCLNRLASRKGIVRQGLDCVRNLAEPDWTDENGLRKKLEEIYQEIDRLPEKTRMVLKAVLLENKKYRDVAVEMNISENTVKTLLARGLAVLRNRLNNTTFIFLFSLWSRNINFI